MTKTVYVRHVIRCNLYDMMGQKWNEFQVTRHSNVSQ